MLLFLEDSNDLGINKFKFAPESFLPEDTGGVLVIKGGDPKLGIAVCLRLKL